jgi:uncharacterized membrane protein
MKRRKILLAILVVVVLMVALLIGVVVHVKSNTAKAVEDTVSMVKQNFGQPVQETKDSSCGFAERGFAYVPQCHTQYTAYFHAPVDVEKWRGLLSQLAFSSPSNNGIGGVTSDGIGDGSLDKRTFFQAYRKAGNLSLYVNYHPIGDREFDGLPGNLADAEVYEVTLYSEVSD